MKYDYNWFMLKSKQISCLFVIMAMCVGGVSMAPTIMQEASNNETKLEELDALDAFALAIRYFAETDLFHADYEVHTWEGVRRTCNQFIQNPACFMDDTLTHYRNHFDSTHFDSTNEPLINSLRDYWLKFLSFSNKAMKGLDKLLFMKGLQVEDDKNLQVFKKSKTEVQFLLDNPRSPMSHYDIWSKNTIDQVMNGILAAIQLLRFPTMAPYQIEDLPVSA